MFFIGCIAECFQSVMCDLPWVSRIRLELVRAGSARHSGQQQAGWQCQSVRAAADRLAVPLSQGAEAGVYIAVLCAVIERSEALSV